MTQTILQALISCESLLRRVKEVFWADKLLAVIQGLQNEEKSESVLIREILLLYGGMGSFNDLILSVHNDHDLYGLDEGKVNDELHELRNKIYEFARSYTDDMN